MPPPSARPGSRSVGLGCAIALATFALFASSLRNGFIELFDDTLYVLANEHVLEGLGARGVAWAFTTTHAYNWHPLTWLSHMADVSLFGLEPWGHHLSSALLHAGCAVLVFALARSFGLAAWTAAFAAGAFAFHPLRVQSVAWVAERKDVLSGVFGLGALLLWVRWARSPTTGRYAAALVAFALGLLAKPMLVSLPAVLLLLDLWPLRRTGADGPGPRRLILEKVPFAALSVACAGTTLALQSFSRAAQGNDAFSLADRLANAAVAPFAYLAKIAWPTGLSVYYPHRGAEISVSVALAAAAGLAAITASAWRLRTRAPYLLVGWGWFLVMLLPVIGIVQAGRQGMADRYTYLPAIGLVLALAALGEDVLRAFRTEAPRTVAGAIAAVLLTALATSTYVELGRWRDGETLFRRAAMVTERNALAANALGVLAARKGRLDDARELYAKAVEYDPGFGVARLNYASLLLAAGRTPEAAPQAAAAARLLPSDAQARYVHGVALATQGRLAEAVGEFELAVSLRPGDASARAALAQARGQLGATQQRAAP